MPGSRLKKFKHESEGSNLILYKQISTCTVLSGVTCFLQNPPEISLGGNTTGYQLHVSSVAMATDYHNNTMENTSLSSISPKFSIQTREINDWKTAKIGGVTTTESVMLPWKLSKSQTTSAMVQVLNKNGASPKSAEIMIPDWTTGGFLFLSNFHCPALKMMIFDKILYVQ